MRYGEKLNLLVHVGEGPRRGQFYDFENQQSGDALGLVTRCTNLSGKKLIIWVRNFIGEASTVYTKEKSLWSPITPIPDDIKHPDIFNNPFLNFMLKDGAMEDTRFPYRDFSGNLLGYVVRIIKQNGSKITPPLAYCQNQNGFQAWRWHAFFETKRTPYGAEKLSRYLGQPILIVEGEKTAAAAQKLFPEWIVLSWIGGVGSVHLTQWDFLAGRDVVLWPDNDQPGILCMQRLQQLLQQVPTKISSIVPLPVGTPQAWDLADCLPKGWSHEALLKLVHETLNSAKLMPLNSN